MMPEPTELSFVMNEALGGCRVADGSQPAHLDFHYGRRDARGQPLKLIIQARQLSEGG
jgi:hypothetical protein